jgi:DNA replication protein DnaC
MRAPALDDSLTERVGKRIRSRLYEMCRTVEIFAPDYRKEIRHAGRFRS